MGKNNKKKHSKSNITEKSMQDTETIAENLESDISESQHIETTRYNKNKRTYTDNDSDHEDKPKKKKKKQFKSTETDKNKKGKKSNRQMKKEKLAQRQAEAQAAAKDQLKSQCLSYLSQWKHDRQNWKFMKAKQVWLFKNKFSETLMPNASWPVLLEYFESAKGNIRNMLLTDANKVIKKMDEWTESQGSEEKDGEDNKTELELNKPDEVTYKRARDLIQYLQE